MCCDSTAGVCAQAARPLPRVCAGKQHGQYPPASRDRSHCGPFRQKPRRRTLCCRAEPWVEPRAEPCSRRPLPCHRVSGCRATLCCRAEPRSEPSSWGPPAYRRGSRFRVPRHNPVSPRYGVPRESSCGGAFIALMRVWLGLGWSVLYGLDGVRRGLLSAGFVQLLASPLSIVCISMYMVLE